MLKIYIYQQVLVPGSGFVLELCEQKEIIKILKSIYSLTILVMD